MQPETTARQAALQGFTRLSFRPKGGILMRPENKISPFGRNDKVGPGRLHQLFGDELNTLIEQLNENLAA